MEFRIAAAARVTGDLLRTAVIAALREHGIAQPNAVICYGAGYTGTLPALNANCSQLSKREQTQKLYETLPAGQTLRIYTPAEAEQAFRDEPNLVLLSRNEQHSKGRDITVVLEGWQVPARVAAGASYFTKYVPSQGEFRVWVGNAGSLAVYEKRLTEHGNCKKIGRNRANGFTFHSVERENSPQNLRRLAVAAVRALHLDFGAVDILQIGANEFSVLEVNSAPGVADERRSALVRLTNSIVSWIERGCPRRG